MNIAFVGQMQYFDCSIPEKIKGVDQIHKIHVNGDFMKPDNYSVLLGYPDIDYWFFFRGEFLPQNIADKLPGVKVNISTEPLQRSDTPYCLKATIGKFDKMYHYDKTHLNSLQGMGIKVDGSFQLPVNLNLYRPIDILSHGKSWDVGFIGRSTDSRERHFDLFTPKREAYMGTLKHYRNFLHISHGMYGEDLVHILNRIKIHLNIHISTYTQLQHRMQNIAACKQFIVSEPLSHEEDFKPYKHFVPFKSATDLHQEVEYYLENGKEREKIATNAFEMVKERFDAEKEWAKLIERVKA